MNRRIRPCVLAVLLVGGGASLAAQQPPGPHAIITEFYTDGTYTELCGQRFYHCNGQTSRWGCLTAYSIRYSGLPCL